MPAHANFWSAYFDRCDNVYLHKKLCLNIKNLEKKVIISLSWHENSVNLNKIEPRHLKTQNPRPDLSPLDRQNRVTRMSTRRHIKILHMETTILPVGAFLKTITSVLWKRFCRTNLASYMGHSKLTA